MTAVERCRVVVLVMVDLTTAVNTTDQTILLNILLRRFFAIDGLEGSGRTCPDGSSSCVLAVTHVFTTACAVWRAVPQGFCMGRCCK